MSGLQYTRNSSHQDQTPATKSTRLKSEFPVTLPLTAHWNDMRRSWKIQLSQSINRLHYYFKCCSGQQLLGVPKLPSMLVRMLVRGLNLRNRSLKVCHNMSLHQVNWSQLKLIIITDSLSVGLRVMNLRTSG